MTSRIISVPIDCTDPVRLAGFWADVLGWRIRETGFQRTEHGPDGAVLIAARPAVASRSTSGGCRTVRRRRRTGCTSTSTRSTGTRRRSLIGCWRWARGRWTSARATVRGTCWRTRRATSSACVTTGFRG